ncbi:hypothetical protein KSS87_018832 [Heliosperma pusillum]|nr:hypothetical protein KSS87_018832 [Heliosperma pusillum]
MCRYPPYELINEFPPIADNGKLIPIVDLADPRSLTVRRIYNASREVEFFRVINHGVPKQALKNIITSVNTFHEDKDDLKKFFYSRDSETKYLKGTHFFSNIDLYYSRAATWHDMFTYV